MELRPDYTPYELLPATAFNIQNIGDLGIGNTNIMYPNDYSLEEIGGILAHEDTHGRQIPTTKKGNQGYTTFAGGKGIQEKSPMTAEDSFWNLLKLINSF